MGTRFACPEAFDFWMFVFGLLVAFFISSLPNETPWVARETQQTIFGKVLETITRKNGQMTRRLQGIPKNRVQADKNNSRN